MENNKIIELNCNIDDNNGEELGFLLNKLEQTDVLDFWVVSAIGKKNRPVYILNILLLESDLKKTSDLLFKHTCTSGIRYLSKERIILKRYFKNISTKYGNIKIKFFESDDGKIKKWKPEYNDIKKTAEEKNISILEIRNEISKILK